MDTDTLSSYIVGLVLGALITLGLTAPLSKSGSNKILRQHGEMTLTNDTLWYVSNKTHYCEEELEALYAWSDDVIIILQE